MTQQREEAHDVDAATWAAARGGAKGFAIAAACTVAGASGALQAHLALLAAGHRGSVTTLTCIFLLVGAAAREVLGLLPIAAYLGLCLSRLGQRWTWRLQVLGLDAVYVWPALLAQATGWPWGRGP